MDLSLHACHGCPIAISNRVEKRNWLVLVGPIIDQMAHKSQNNFCVKQACLMVPHVSRCPSLPYPLKALAHQTKADSGFVLSGMLAQHGNDVLCD